MYISYNCAISFLDSFTYIIISLKEKEDELIQLKQTSSYVLGSQEMSQRKMAFSDAYSCDLFAAKLPSIHRIDLKFARRFLRPNCTGGVSFWHFITSRLHRITLIAKLGQTQNAVDFHHRSILMLHVIKEYGYRSDRHYWHLLTPTIAAVDSLRLFPCQRLFHTYWIEWSINQLAIFIQWFPMISNDYSVVAFEWMLELKLITQLYAVPKFETRQKFADFLIKSP